MVLPRLVGEQARQQGGIQWDTREMKTELVDPINGKPLYRKCVDFGALPDTAKKDVAHSISTLNVAAGAFLQFWCFATDGTNFYDAKCHANVTICTIEATNVSITADADLSGLDGFFLVEYTKT